MQLLFQWIPLKKYSWNEKRQRDNTLKLKTFLKKQILYLKVVALIKPNKTVVRFTVSSGLYLLQCDRTQLRPLQVIIHNENVGTKNILSDFV